MARSFGLLANTIEDLAADLILQEKYLSPVPNLQHDTYNQIGYMNTNFRVSEPFLSFTCIFFLRTFLGRCGDLAMSLLMSYPLRCS